MNGRGTEELQRWTGKVRPAMHAGEWGVSIHPAHCPLGWGCTAWGISLLPRGAPLCHIQGPEGGGGDKF